MPIDDRQLIALASAADDQNRVAMETMHDEIAEVHFGETGEMLRDARRRHFLKGAFMAAPMIAVGSQFIPLARFMPAAWAAGEMSDADLARFAAGAERAAVAAYAAAEKTGKLNDTETKVAKLFADHHTQHAGEFEAILESDPITANKTMVDQFGGKITAAADDKAILEVAYQVENGAAATYLFALGVLQDAKNAAAVATILPVESMHAVALGTVLGKKLTDDGMVPPFETDTEALSPDKYPAAR